MPERPVSRLLVSKVPKVPGKLNGSYPGPIVDLPSDADGFRMNQDQTLKSHASQLLMPGFQDFVLTQNEVSCRFKVKMSQRNGDKGPTFRALVHDGSITHVKKQLGTVSCAIVACENNDIESCPYRYKTSEVVFEELEIKMKTRRIPYNTTLYCDNAVYYPNTLQTNRFPLAPKYYTFTKVFPQDNDKRVTATITLKEAKNGLTTFGIWGRILPRDILHHAVEHHRENKNVEHGEKVENDIFF